MHNTYRIVLCLFLVLPVTAFAQTNTTTFTSSASSEIIPGSTPSVYIATTSYIGPQTIRTGSQTGCMLTVSPPPAGCTLSGGGGTLSNPFAYACSSTLPLTGCSGGTLFAIASGATDIDTFLLTVDPLPRTAQPVPLSPWVPLVSAIVVMLLLIVRRFRLARR